MVNYDLLLFKKKLFVNYQKKNNIFYIHVYSFIIQEY